MVTVAEAEIVTGPKVPAFVLAGMLYDVFTVCPLFQNI